MEAELLRILQQEEVDSSTYFDSELASAQAEAMARFHAQPYGTEEPNRSAIVTRDVADMINWTMPHLMRHFTQSEDLLEVNDDAIDDQDLLQDAADFLRHVLFKDNKGEETIYDFIFDGLLQKVGVIRTSWEPGEVQPEELLEGLTYDQVLKYQNDRRYRILSGTIDGEIEGGELGAETERGDVPQAPGEQPAVNQPAAPQLPDPAAGPPGGIMAMPQQQPQQQGLLGGLAPAMSIPETVGPEPTFSIIVQKVSHGRACFDCIPPEEFRISRRARSIEEAPYHAWKTVEYVAKLARDHPEKAYDLDPNSARGMASESDLESYSDVRLQERFPLESETQFRTHGRDDAARRQVPVLIEYIRGDFDQDGVVELRRIKRVGETILENDIVKESEFTMWTPIRVAHRAIGQSMADTLLGWQRARTAVLRRGLDSVSQSTAPRMAISKQAMATEEGLVERLLDHSVGDVIPVDGKPSDALFPLVTPDVSGQAYQAFEFMGKLAEESAGVNRQTMGIRPEAIHDTAKGLDNLQASGGSRLEQYARWAAVGLQEACNKILRLLMKHQDQERIVKVNGRQMRVDPRRWSDEMTVSVHVGMAAESREKKLMYLNMIKQDQDAIIAAYGVSNPIVSVKEARTTRAYMLQAMGFKSAQPFYKEVDPNWQPPAPGPDPKLAEVQQKGQLAQLELQQKGQIAQAEAQSKGHLAAAEFQHKSQLAELEEQRRSREMEQKAVFEANKLQSDKALEEARLVHQIQLANINAEMKAREAALKAENERAIAEMRALQESALARERLEMETTLAREKMNAEMRVAGWKAAQDVKTQRAKVQKGVSVKVSKKKKAQPKAKPNGANGAIANGASPNFASDGINSVRMGGKVG